MATLAGYQGAFYASRRNCLQFDASNETLTVTDPSGGELDFAAASNFSLGVWAQIAATGDGLVVAKYASATGYKFEISSNKPVFTIGDGSFEPAITGDTSVNDGKWHHFLCVRDVSEDKIYLYLDGASDATAVTDTTTATLANAANLVVGATTTGNLRRVGQVRVYSTDLTAGNAADLAIGDMPDVTTYIVGSWACINGTGSTVRDDSGNNNSATVANATWSTVTYDSVSTETPSGAINGTNKTYTLANENVDNENITITVDASPLAAGDYTLTPKGTIVCVTAPAATITVDYRHYAMTLECGEFFNWSLDYAGDALDVTTFTSGGPRQYIPGLTTWTATAERFIVHGGYAHDMGGKFVCEFYHDEANAKYLDGWGIVSGIAPNLVVDEVINERVSFQGTQWLGVETS